ncbi:hypothetical protein VNO78_15646 [Psophocarpus tetragonolobus]|uniref:Uncharacterized protein n=1 Tax=Psophocarpus tetragonolobus TaxID=3891 RepID=A0AAN9SGF8_PSOTE
MSLKQWKEQEKLLSYSNSNFKLHEVHTVHLVSYFEDRKHGAISDSPKSMGDKNFEGKLLEQDMHELMMYNGIEVVGQNKLYVRVDKTLWATDGEHVLSKNHVILDEHIGGSLIVHSREQDEQNRG